MIAVENFSSVGTSLVPNASILLPMVRSTSYAALVTAPGPFHITTTMPSLWLTICYRGERKAGQETPYSQTTLIVW